MIFGADLPPVRIFRIIHRVRPSLLRDYFGRLIESVLM
jgi:hypothetical protein